MEGRFKIVFTIHRSQLILSFFLSSLTDIGKMLKLFIRCKVEEYGKSYSVLSIQQFIAKSRVSQFIAKSWGNIFRENLIISTKILILKLPKLQN